MSQINFDRLQADLPEYGAVWSALRTWFASNWRRRYAELSVLLRAVKAVNPIEVVFALEHMVQRGMLRVAYRVKAPGGYLLEESFPEPDKIPEKLWDRDGSRQIPTAEGDIVSGFGWEPADAAA
jgi:hypothetical protein